MAIVSWRPPRTVSRDGNNRLVYIYVAQSLPVDRRIKQVVSDQFRVSFVISQHWIYIAKV
jgi:hypothetical protein